MKRFLVSLLLCLTLVFSTTVGFAASNSNQDLSADNNKFLTQDEVLKLAEYDLATYVIPELNNNIKLQVDRSLIELKDVNENKYVYLLSIQDEGRNIGYMIIDARKNGYGVIERSLNNNESSLIRMNFSELKSGDSMLYMFPSLFIVKEKIGDNINYKQIKENGEKKDITNFINARKNDIKESINELYKNRSNIRIPTSLNATSQNESVSVLDEPNFVPVYGYDENVGYVHQMYGGNQIWFSEKLGQDEGCGTVAAANIAYYLAKYRYGYENLYKYSDITKDNFIKHMEEVYKYVTPSTSVLPGIPSKSDLVIKFESFAKSRGVNLKADLSDIPHSIEPVSTYIKAGLSKNSPVAFLMNYNSKYPEFNFHWMTITKYFRNVTTDERDIAVSSWATRYSLNLKYILDYDQYLSVAFVYFE
ncbi:hypothetical protein [Thermoanaerobacterium thermosaccharolyticum]|uniref:hypothetical protein n=1 Tax=Thermoanaerobacterium thermosaccharolyticum TaxID=1517 RepID=UPI0020A4B9C3|nr:hypothetical protein [Thermoanaerobacterium thermosaccharolyticum]MCP2240501.1 hypothetical protein [Thermoanaerobacterium thermosaccharolyticum]